MIAKYLDLSTGHVTRKTMRNMPNLIAEHEFGCFVYVSPCEDENIPPELKLVFEYAKDNGAYLIRFDCDGERIPELEFFDW